MVAARSWSEPRQLPTNRRGTELIGILPARILSVPEQVPVPKTALCVVVVVVVFASMNLAIDLYILLCVLLWQQKGEDDAIDFLSRANRGYTQTLVRWVWVEEDAALRYQPRVSLDKLEALQDEETVALLASSADGHDFLLLCPIIVKRIEQMDHVKLDL